MKLASFAAVALAAAAFTAPVLAADVTAANPESVRKALADLGYTAELTTSASGVSSISLNVDGSPTYVDFWNCDDKKANCETLMLVYGMDLADGTTAEKANEWNFDTIHGFVYLDENMDPWLNITVPTGMDGISTDLFGTIMRTWRNRIGDARDFFDL